MENHPLCSSKITNKVKNIHIRLTESHLNILHRKWRRQNSRRYLKGKKAMKKIQAKSIQKLCFINSWKISKVFLLTVYSLLLVYKKLVTAVLFSKLRIAKMKSQVKILKKQIFGNFQHLVLAYQIIIGMKNAKK